MRSPASLLTLALATLAGCAATPSAQTTTADIAIFGINDFHGHIQSANPTPRMMDVADPADATKKIAVPAGGAAYLATELAHLRAADPHNITVGVGDLIGASPLTSSMLDDEPTLEVLNRLGLSVSTVGNHEFDAGSAALLRRIKGECPQAGCKLPGFTGAHFDYLGANVIDKASGKPLLKPYVIREIDGIKLAFVGAPLHEIPTLVSAAGISTLRFADEVSAINALIPEIRAQGIETIVALIHQGGEYNGSFNDPSYRCDGLKGPIIDIVKRLDPAVDVVMSAHTHNGYTCKIDGRLLTQGASYGALVSEVKLKIDRRTGDVVQADATNHLVDQRSLTPDPDIARFVDEVAQTTQALRTQAVGMIAEPLNRRTTGAYGDSSLGNLVADAQWAYAKQFGPVDFAMTNNGGLRADLPVKPTSERPVKLQYGDLFASQPFKNAIVVISLSGAQILDLLRGQWHGDASQAPDLLQVSRSFSYRWDNRLPLAQRVFDVRVKGEALVATRQYRVAINSFLAGGGDHTEVLTRGSDAVVLPGLDVDALRAYTESAKEALNVRSEGRIVRVDSAAEK